MEVNFYIIKLNVKIVGASIILFGLYLNLQ